MSKEKEKLLSDSALPIEEEPPPEEDRSALEPITPTDEFYITSSAPIPSEEWVENWQLTIRGLGEEDKILTLEELQSFDAQEVEHTLECIGNRGPRQISNGKWLGVLLLDVLSALGLVNDKSHINMRCGDGYLTSLPVSVIEDGLRLVWTLNGEPLSMAHGKPVRLLVPDRFGMKNPKWIEEIEFTDSPELGYWENVGWSNTAFYQIHSWFHSPSANAWLTGGEGIDVFGSAFAGKTGVSKVEISLDEGESWEECEITYPGGENIWTCWRYRWNPPTTGSFTFMVRATDNEGRLQEDIEDADENLDGFEGIMRLTVFVN